MEFVAEFIEIICMLALVFGIAIAVLYFVRHRARINRWVNNYGSKDNTAEKEDRIRALRRRKEDAEVEIAQLESETQEEK